MSDGIGTPLTPEQQDALNHVEYATEHIDKWIGIRDERAARALDLGVDAVSVAQASGIL